MWPFSSLSLENSSKLYDIANIFFVISLMLGVAATFAIVRLGNVKEFHWDALREISNQKIAGLELETENAKIELSKANILAEMARSAAETARADASKAEERTAVLNLESQRLKIVVEVARSEIQNIQSGVSSRHISVIQATAIKNAIFGHAAALGIINEVTGDIEVGEYVKEIELAFNGSGIKVEIGNNLRFPPPYGIVLAESVAIGNSIIAKALTDAAISFEFIKRDGPTQLKIGVKRPPF